VRLGYVVEDDLAGLVKRVGRACIWRDPRVHLRVEQGHLQAIVDALQIPISGTNRRNRDT